MVEFGLKLEDNKVDEWSEEYIDYERLKELLKKARKAMERRDELVQRRPVLAAEIEHSYLIGSMRPGESPSRGSMSMLSSSMRGGGGGMETELLQNHMSSAGWVDKVPSISDPQHFYDAADDESEHQVLISRTSNLERYGSEISLASGDMLNNQSMTASSTGLGGGRGEDSLEISDPFKRIMSGMSSTVKYDSQLREALKRVDSCHLAFEKQLFHELDKVNVFYEKKLVELSDRLKFLTEGVDASDFYTPNATRRLRKRPNNKDMRDDFKQSTREVITENMISMVSRFRDSIVVGANGIEQERGRIMHGLEGFESEGHLQLLPPDDDNESHVVLDREEKRKWSEAMGDQIIRESDSIKRALADLYRQGTLLHNFVIMNYTGFVKIIKKHDKAFPSMAGMFYDRFQNTEVCNDGDEVEKLNGRMQEAYAEWFCDGNVREAEVQLLPKKGDGLQMDWSQLRLGYRLGMCAILCLWVCWDCVWGLVRDGNSTIGGRTAFPVFRACGGLLLLHWFWGCSVYVWTRYRINYIFLFDLDPRIVETPIAIFNHAVDETLVFLVSMLLYYKSGAHDIPDWVPPGIFPLALVIYTVSCLLFPLRTRMPMWNAIWKVITAPLTSPTFFTIYLADVFTSMVKVFQDVAWTVGFVASRDFMVSEDELDANMHEWQHSFWYKNVLIPIICLFPLWVRFNQCLRRYLDTGKRMPNLANAFKYAMSQMVTLFGAFHPLYVFYKQPAAGDINYFQLFWMALFVSSSLYSFFWDVVMDWGLGRLQYGFLGPRLMFPKRIYYYGVIVLDLVLRFMWVLTLVPPQSGANFEIPQYLSAVTMSLELMRRTMWGFFRLENEHRNNTEHYRRVSFVPLHFNTGHKHRYAHERQHVGWSVLVEVLFVTCLVIGVSAVSVIAAQRASHHANSLSEF